MDGNTSTSDVEGKNNLIDAVLHTAEQHSRSEKHMKLLKQRGDNPVPILCSGAILLVASGFVEGDSFFVPLYPSSHDVQNMFVVGVQHVRSCIVVNGQESYDISSLESKSMDDVGTLHLIVDTCLYRILMDDGYICDVARRKFKELDKLRRKIYVLDTFQTELDDLIHQIPKNARTLWNKDSPIEQHGHRLPNNEKIHMAVTGVAGGSVTTANTVGVNEGEFGNKSNEMSMVVHAENYYHINCQSIGKGDSSIRVKEGSESCSHNNADVTIMDAEHEEALFVKLANGMDKLKSNDVHEVKIEKGSIIIRLTVDKRCIMTEEWIQGILKMIFHDILGDLFTEETKFEVSVERHISMSVEDFLRLYSSHQSHDELDANMKKMVDDDNSSILSADSGLVLTDDLGDLDYSDSAELMTKTLLGRNRGSKLSVSGYDITECRKCETIVENTELPIPAQRYLVTHAPTNLINPYAQFPRVTVRTKDEQTDRRQWKEARRRLCWKLKCLVSAIQNSGGGVVLVHIDGLERTDTYLGYFHELMDPHLNHLLENGCLFFNTFRITWLESICKEIGKGPNDLFCNVVFVKCMPSDSVITVNFNTKVGNDFEILNPTSEQLRRYLKTQHKFLKTVPRVRGLGNLQESLNVVVRALYSADQKEEWCHQDPCRLAEHTWKVLRLNYSVSAFSKVEGGGSFYLGVLTTRKNCLTYVSKQLLIEGFQYEEQLFDSLIAALRRQIETDTLVLYFDSEAPPTPLPPEYVNIEFHKVSPNRFVLEVAIAAVNGLVFHTKEGPEAYELDEENMLHRLTIQEWKSRFLMES